MAAIRLRKKLFQNLWRNLTAKTGFETASSKFRQLPAPKAIDRLYQPFGQGE
jgi:hypothetical protein